MYRAIIFSRVSSGNQDIDSQAFELQAFAQKYYEKHEILPIEYTESGLSSDEDRKGLIDLYAKIKEHKIECVFATEFTRLSRKPSGLNKIIEFLEEHKCNLRLIEKSFVLLDENKKIPEHIELLLGLMFSMVKSDSKLRIQRFIQGRAVNAQKGNYNGGNRKLGYKIVPIENCKNNRKRYEIDEYEGEIVKKIFNLCYENRYGAQKLYKDLERLGYKIGFGTMQKILKDRVYTGELTEITKRIGTKKVKKEDGTIGRIEIAITRLPRKYPKIIEPWLFEECKKIREGNNTNLSKSKRVYYSHRKIVCSCCGSYLKAIAPKNIYRCPNVHHAVKEINCTGKDSININVIDSLLWGCASELEVTHLLRLDKKNLITLESDKANIQIKLDVIEKRYNVELEKNKDFFAKQNIFSEKEIEEFATRKSIPKKNELQKEKEDFLKEMDRIDRKISELNEFFSNGGRTGVNRIEQLTKDVHEIEDTERKKIIAKHIKEVSISVESKTTKRIEIKYFNEKLTENMKKFGVNNMYYYDAMKKDKTKRLYWYGRNGEKQYMDYKIRFDYGTEVL